MELFEAIDLRRSVRVFRQDPIPPDRLERILLACNSAPSAGNLQAYQIQLVEEPGVREALAAAAYEQAFIRQAPVALVFSTNPGRAQRYGTRGATLYSVQDATVAVAYAQLAATALGLATCWVGAFEEAKVARVLGIEPPMRPIVILPIGVAGEIPPPVGRRPLDELVRRG